MIQGYQAKLLRARRARSQSNLRARRPICGPRARGPALFSGLMITMKKDDDDDGNKNDDDGDKTNGNEDGEKDNENKNNVV